jgi:flavin-dependent thymidylate synthase
MQVTLLKYDKDALDLLVMSKQTRLNFTPADLQQVRDWPEEKKLAELNYMLGTIESSWEFADYMFLITGVTRAFTHQLVRSREGSYAQQSQRTVDMSGFEFIATGKIAGGRPRTMMLDEREVALGEGRDLTEEQRVYVGAMGDINDAYQHLVSTCEIPPQDARGLLPTNVATAIIGKFNLRTLSHMAALRLCTRTQGEYQDVFQEMRNRVIEVHPWAEPFLRVHCARHGVCAFPHYKECPIKGPIFNPDTGTRWDRGEGMGDVPSLQIKLPATRAEIQDSWVQLQRGGGYQAVPKVKATDPVICSECRRESFGQPGARCTNRDEHGPCTGHLQLKPMTWPGIITGIEA